MDTGGLEPKIFDSGSDTYATVPIIAYEKT
jgi:hypothetical protein